MMIRVMYHDGKTEMVRQPLLRHLIKTWDIQKFRRNDGWVLPGVDAIREHRRQPYDGKDRREGAAKH
ncbi:MAG TPA: hypothetical protein VJ974_07505 [Geopsychrobacteraceae bacterium]|nr:hypothetical protein [Geopsychrobacteraceae bacterium]